MPLCVCGWAAVTSINQRISLDSGHLIFTKEISETMCVPAQTGWSLPRSGETSGRQLNSRSLSPPRLVRERLRNHYLHHASSGGDNLIHDHFLHHASSEGDSGILISTTPRQRETQESLTPPRLVRR